MPDLPPGHVLVLLRDIPERRIVVDLKTCQWFVVDPPYSQRQALDPQAWPSLPTQVFCKTPENLWIWERGEREVTHMKFYSEVHPVFVAHNYLLVGKPLPRVLEPYRQQATGKAYFEWHKEQVDNPTRSCVDGIETPPGPNDARNKFCYEEKKKGTKLAAILRDVNATEGWGKLGSSQAINDAADAHAEKNKLPIIRRIKRT
jgi:hypothetical protein